MSDNQLTHRKALARAFKAIRKHGAVALENRGITVSAGWEDLREECAKKKIDPPNGLFWTKQSNDFSSDGSLLSSLYIQWVGDSDMFCDALEAQGLDVERPADEDQSILVKTTRLTGGETAEVSRLSGPLLDAVLAQPDEDAPKLAMGKALVEAGDERGEFILLHMEYATKGKLSKVKFKRLRELHVKVAQDFCPPHIEPPGYCESGIPFDEYIATNFCTKFNGGFLYAAMTPGDHSDYNEELESWELIAAAPDIDFRSPLWATVEEISVWKVDHLKALAESPLAARIKALSASVADFSVVNPAAFPALRAIQVSGIGDLNWLRKWKQIQTVNLLRAQPHQPVLDAAEPGSNVQFVIFGSTHTIAYERDDAGSFTRLKTNERWPISYPDWKISLAEESERISRSVTHVFVGRVKDFTETHYNKSIAKELKAIAAMFAEILPAAEVTFAGKKTKKAK